MTLSKQNLEILISELMDAHYGKVGSPPTAQPATPDPEEEARLDSDAAHAELELIAQALSQHDGGAFHRDYLRGANDIRGLLDGRHGEYAKNVIQGVLSAADALPTYIGSPESAAAFVAGEVQRMTNILDDRQLSPQEMHDPAGNALATEADRELLRDGSELFSDERAHAAGESFKAEMAKYHGQSVDALEAQERSDWDHNATTVIDGRIFADDVEDTPGVEYGEDPWGHGVDEVARTIEADWDAWDAQQRELDELSDINALAPVAPDQEMLDAIMADRARANISEFPPEMRQSREAETERWGELLREDAAALGRS